MIPVVDISQYQGAWVDRGEAADMIKMSGGDAGLYMDQDAAANYTAAKAHGKGVGGYHFIGWTLGAIAEATYFLQAMSPLAENDVYALDIEAIKIADPVSYVLEMVNFIHGKIGVWPLVYMNLSTLNSYNWDSVLANCGLWLADWNNDPNATIPTIHTYVMQQYSDGPNYDHDEFFGTLEEFNKYGYHVPQAVAPAQKPSANPVQAPVVAPIPQPVIITPPTTETAPVAPVQASEPPVSSPSANAETKPTQPEPTSTTTLSNKNQYPKNNTTIQQETSISWWQEIINWLKRVFHL